MLPKSDHIQDYLQKIQAAFPELIIETVESNFEGYGESFLRRIGKFYPGIGEHIERARFWAGTLELQWLLGGLRSDDKSWFAVHIGRARDVLPVGSGW